MSWSSGTNTIKEGGEAKNLTLQMLEVPKQSGGTELFVRKSDVTLGTKSISQNGTYTAASDGKYGFSQVSVNVRGGNGSADSSGKPTGTVPPGGSGSAVVGTDPDTGNDQVVGVDSSGNLVKTPLPSSIVIVTNPTKMTYSDGESIDLSGAVVVAKNADGTTWTSVDYPNGHVSCTPEPETADKDAVEDEYEIVNPTIDGIQTTATIRVKVLPVGEYKNSNDTYNKINNLAERLVTFNGDTFISVPIGVGQIQFSSWSVSVSPGGDSATFDGKTVRWEAMNYAGVQVFLRDQYGYPSSNASSLTNAQIAWLMKYAVDTETVGKQRIQLNWSRPGDGKVLSTTMEITVAGSSQTTESSSGTGDSGGGGTF